MRSKSAAWGEVLPCAALLLLVLVVAGPLWGPGLLNTRGGGDSPFLLLRTHQLAANLRVGVFPVRWMPDAAYGFGYPFFSYYAALPYYLTAGLHLIGLDILSAIKLTQTLFFAAAALAMYGWARRVLDSRAGGWLAASAYTLAPFHLINVYVRGDSLSEFAAFAFYPLILWGLDYLAARPTLRRTLPSALAYAGLILTHNVSALIFTPFILLYALLYILRLTFHSSQRPSRSLLFILPLLIGLLLSTWFWVPALAEMDYVQLTAQTSGYFFYGGHFRGLDLVQRGVIFDYVISPDSPSPFAMGLVQALFALLGILVIIVRQARHVPTCTLRAARSALHARHCTLATLGFLLSTWLITPLSHPLWDHVPLLPMIQFPWRFLSVQALFVALLTGAVVTPLRRRRKIQVAVGVFVAVLLGVASLAGLRPEYLPIAADEVTVERLHLYELLTGNVGSTIRYEYLPRWVQPRPYTGPALFDPGASPQAIPLDGGLVRAKRITREPTRRTWQVEVDATDVEIAFPLYYWPGWRAKVDGEPVEVRPHPDSGYLTLNVPAGTHLIELWLGRTPLQLGAELASLIAALILLPLWIVGRRSGAEELGSRGARGQKGKGAGEQRTAWPFAILGLAFLVLLGALVALRPRITASDAFDLTMDFDRMPYLHHNPAGVDFGDWRMTNYRYSADELVPGDRLHVTLDSEGNPGNGTMLRLVSPAAVRRGTLPAIAESMVNASSLELPIPQDLGPGLYLIQLESEAKSIHLRPIWVRNVEGEGTEEQPVQGTFADGALFLHAVEASQHAPDRLDVQLIWSAARSIAANYGLSLRLTDAGDNEWVRLDTQPGYGFRPTSLWPVKEPIHDRLALSLPEGIPPSDDYTLSVILYRVASWESVGRVDHAVSLPRATRRPDAPVVTRFGDELALSQIDVPRRVQQGGDLNVTAYWLAVGKPSMDYVAEWRLENLSDADSSIRPHLAAHSQPLAPGSSPTAWPAGAWIAGKVTLPISPTVPPGDYNLSLTLREPGGEEVLGTYEHPQPVRVRERERVWELPPMQQEVNARFGDVIALAGYDLEREGEKLRLRLHWRALAVPDRHYMLFVHLADPTTGQPVAQVDTMPRAFTYPTGVWAPDEVISDEVVLSLEDVPDGEYDLAVGWYNPETRTRLPASDEEDNSLPDDRLILPDAVVLP